MKVRLFTVLLLVVSLAFLPALAVVARAAEHNYKPAGIDLDVTYISRTPLYNCYEVWYTSDGKPYLRPGTENYKRWPSPGEVVTFTAHIINKGTVDSGSFAFKWFIDGVEVHSGHSSLAKGQEGMENYYWVCGRTSLTASGCWEATPFVLPWMLTTSSPSVQPTHI